MPKRVWRLSKAFFRVEDLPLDVLARQAVGDDPKLVDAGIGVLEILHRHGRAEAGVFLVGLLACSGDDWKRRERVVRALRGFAHPGLVQFLCDELRRVKGSNKTRRYLNAILEVLQSMPAELVRDALWELAEDRSLSRRMRQKAEQAFWAVVVRSED